MNKIENSKNEIKYINYDQVKWVEPSGSGYDMAYFNNKPFTGIVYENFTNGKRAVEGEFVDSKRHGRQTSYYANGYIQWEKTFKDGEFEGWSVEMKDTEGDKDKPHKDSGTNIETSENSPEDQGMLIFSSYSAHPPSKNGEFNAHNSNYFQIFKYDDNGISSLGFVDSYGGIGKGKDLSIPVLLDGNSIILKSIGNWDEGSDDQYFIQMEDCSSIAKKYNVSLTLRVL